MSGESLPVRKGERVPRRALSKFNETDEGLMKGIFAHGWKVWKVALDDENQYGPHAMIVLLLMMSTITGMILGIMWSLLG